MPDGRTHERLNLLVGAGALALWAAAGAPRPDLLLAGGAGYLLGSFLVTPDMDQAGKGSSRALRRWGALWVLWLPYGALFRHRGVSHLWPLGALTRILYLAFLLAPLAPLFGDLPGRLPPGSLPALVAGFLLADLLHVLADGGEKARASLFWAALAASLAFALGGGARGQALEARFAVEASGSAGGAGVAFPSYVLEVSLPLAGAFLLEGSGPSPALGWSLGLATQSRVDVSGAPAEVAVAAGYAFGLGSPLVALRVRYPAAPLAFFASLATALSLEEELPIYVLRAGLSLAFPLQEE